MASFLFAILGFLLPLAYVGLFEVVSHFATNYDCSVEMNAGMFMCILGLTVAFMLWGFGK